jgi:hypothetical protein
VGIEDQVREFYDETGWRAGDAGQTADAQLWEDLRPPPIYFFAHPLSWWKRFSDEAAVALAPWRSLNANESRRLIPDNALGARMFRLVLGFERAFPSWVTWAGCYPLIVLTKRERT